MVSAALGMVGRGGWETHLLGSGMYWGVAGGCGEAPGLTGSPRTALNRSFGAQYSAS